MKKFLTQTVPVFMRFEHATVIVVGGQFIAEHATSAITLVACIILFILFNLARE